jgi:hypothetical protein
MGLGTAGGLGLDEALVGGGGERANPELVRNVYEQLIYECTGISKEALHTARPCRAPGGGDDDGGDGGGGGGTLPRYAELHDESVPVLHFMRALNKLLVAAGVHEGFTLRDLIKPEPARLRRNLSAIINFQKFREEKIEAWACHGRRTVELEAAKAALEAERRDLESALTREKNLRAMEAPAIADLARTVAALAETKADLEATAGRLTASLAEQKATVAELVDGAVRAAAAAAVAAQRQSDNARARSTCCPPSLPFALRRRWTPRPKASRRSSRWRGSRSCRRRRGSRATSSTWPSWSKTHTRRWRRRRPRRRRCSAGPRSSPRRPRTCARR